METFPSPVIGHLLLPEGGVGAIVANTGVQGWEESPIEGIGRLLSLQIGFESGARPFAGHGPLTVERVNKEEREETRQSPVHSHMCGWACDL